MRSMFVALVVSCAGASWLGRAEAAPAFSAEAVDQAIEKGIAFLWSKQSAKGDWGPYGNPAAGHFYPAGPTALAAYALLEAGADPKNNPRMAKTLNWLAKQRTDKTYVLGIRANVWLAADRKARGRFRRLIKHDADQLIASINAKGAYSYTSAGKRPKGSGWDNSNTQYGLLGVWAAAQAYLEVPRKFWPFHMQHWMRTQCRDGGWPYHTGSNPKQNASRATMTAAGIASMFVCFDNVYADRFVGCTGGREEPHIQRGLQWLEKNFAKSMRSPGGYYLYGVERVGLASGRKYFGVQDWYKVGATKLLQRQKPNGGWGSVVETSFALLFLIRGRNAVIFNKLEFDGDWNNRPRDLAMLTRWLNLTFEETTVNWQIINLKVPVTEWHDAPILYISASKAPKFTDEHIDKLRTFVLQGGAIFSVTECNGVGFRKGIREVYRKMFPQYELVEAPRKHPIYTKDVHFDLPGRPKFYILSNGVRPLVIHTDVDLALSWQTRRHTTHRWVFQAATNVAKYVTGKVTLLRPRGTTHWPPPVKAKSKRTVKLARLKHGGTSDPEPLAYERFARLMAQRTATKVDVVGPVAIKDLASTGAKVATLTGLGELKLAQNDRAALKAFVGGGGILVVDAAGGREAFADSAERALKETFGALALRTLASGAPPYVLTTHKGHDIRRVHWRPRTRKKLGGRTTGTLRAVLGKDRRTPAVFFSREDLTAGLVGYPAYTVDGYRPDTAFEIMRNIVLLAAGPDPKPKPATRPAKKGGRKGKAPRPAPKPGKKAPAKPRKRAPAGRKG